MKPQMPLPANLPKPGVSWDLSNKQVLANKMQANSLLTQLKLQLC